MTHARRTADRFSRPRLIGNSAAIRHLCRQIIALGPRRCTVLLQGESGTGKELAARLVHARSTHRGGPFVPVDCTTLRDTLFESQLFGHVRGAFTGADRPTLGFYRAADGGTLFLDEIGELPLGVQAKLLRCVQEGVVMPVGATAGIAVDVRVIAATHRDLAAMVRAGTFREDLYYRLNVAKLRLPPLRERHADIELLVRHALRDFSDFYQEPERTFTAAALAVLGGHDWPGNVRELLNAVEHAVVFAPRVGPLRTEDLPEDLRSTSVVTAAASRNVLTLDAAERRTIAAALEACGGNQSRAARVLDVERHRLRRRIAHHGLTHLVRAKS